jgi:hypothetical protein
LWANQLRAASGAQGFHRTSLLAATDVKKNESLRERPSA